MSSWSGSLAVTQESGCPYEGTPTAKAAVLAVCGPLRAGPEGLE